MSGASKIMPPGWLGRALVEGTLIVFAVVLGFIVNEWRESIDDRRAAQAAMERVVIELESNMARLESVVDYHDSVVIALSERLAELEESGESPEGVIFTEIAELLPRGIEAPSLSRFAWDHAQRHGRLDVLPYELVAETARIYQMQADGVDNTRRLILEKLFEGPDVMRPQDIRASLAFTRIGFSELVSQERYLIRQYRRAAERLRTEMDIPADAALAEAAAKP